jgi:hypothetical protein
VADILETWTKLTCHGAVGQPAAAQPASAHNYQNLARATLQISVINAKATLIVLVALIGVLLGSASLLPMNMSGKYFQIELVTAALVQ